MPLEPISPQYQAVSDRYYHADRQYRLWMGLSIFPWICAVYFVIMILIMTHQQWDKETATVFFGLVDVAPGLRNGVIEISVATAACVVLAVVAIFRRRYHYSVREHARLEMYDIIRQEREAEGQS